MVHAGKYVSELGSIQRMEEEELMTWKNFLEKKVSKDWEPTLERRCIRKDISKICTIMASLGKAKWEHSVFLFWQ